MNFLKRLFGVGKNHNPPNPPPTQFESDNAPKNPQPVPAQGKPKVQSNKQLVLDELEKKLRSHAADLYPYARSFRPPYGKLAVQMVTLARELGSKAPIAIFRDAATEYPNSGLAWYALNYALTMCDDPKSVAAAEALGRAAKYGCDYLKIKDGTITVSLIE